MRLFILLIISVMMSACSGVKTSNLDAASQVEDVQPAVVQRSGTYSLKGAQCFDSAQNQTAAATLSPQSGSEVLTFSGDRLVVVQTQPHSASITPGCVITYNEKIDVDEEAGMFQLTERRSTTSFQHSCDIDFRFTQTSGSAITPLHFLSGADHSTTKDIGNESGRFIELPDGSIGLTIVVQFYRLQMKVQNRPDDVCYLVYSK